MKNTRKMVNKIIFNGDIQEEIENYNFIKKEIIENATILKKLDIISENDSSLDDYCCFDTNYKEIELKNNDTKTIEKIILKKSSLLNDDLIEAVVFDYGNMKKTIYIYV